MNKMNSKANNELKMTNEEKLLKEQEIIKNFVRIELVIIEDGTWDMSMWDIKQVHEWIVDGKINKDNIANIRMPMIWKLTLATDIEVEEYPKIPELPRKWGNIELKKYGWRNTPLEIPVTLSKMLTFFVLVGIIPVILLRGLEKYLPSIGLKTKKKQAKTGTG